ncbi:Ribonuclease P protein subunit p40, partial [Armadillidium nasatum]
VMIHVPNTSTLPNNIIDVLKEDKSFYCIKNLPVQCLCEDDFIKAFIKCDWNVLPLYALIFSLPVDLVKVYMILKGPFQKMGRIYAYTADIRLDLDDCAALTPSGDLFLLLNRFKYNELGISGKLSSHILRFPTHRYLVEIKTNEDCFISGKKIYEKTHRSLASCSLIFDFYITWQPYDKSVCPSSIAKYFHEKGFQVEELFPLYKQTWKSDLKIPKLKNLENNFDHNDLLEWLGMCSVDIDSNIINEICMEDTSELSPLIVSHFEGFYTPSDIQDVIQELREWLLTKDEEIVPWVCLTVYGPPDCLISWSRTENAFKINGENFYIIIIFRNKILYYTVEETTLRKSILAEIYCLMGGVTCLFLARPAKMLRL